MNGPSNGKRQATESLTAKHIHDLPESALIRIWQHVPTERNKIENRHALAMVCRRWRDILQTPDAAVLWTDIDVSLGAPRLRSFPLSGLYSWFLRHAGAVTSLTLEINSIDAWAPVHVLLGASRGDLTCLRVFSDNDDTPCFVPRSALPWLALAPRLQSLELEGVVDTSVEEATLPAGLTHLALNGCGLNGLPAVPSQLSTLLSLSSLSLQFMEPGADFSRLSTLTGLRRLDLSSCNLRMVPDEVTTIPQLTALTLNSNEELGGYGNEERLETLSKLTGLQLLEMRDCSLKSIPSAVVGLSKLHTLLLGYNDFTADTIIPQGPYLESLELLAMSDSISEPTSVLEKVVRPLAAATSLKVLRLNRNWGLTLTTPVVAALLRGKTDFRKLEYSEDMATELDVALVKRKLPMVNFKIVD